MAALDERGSAAVPAGKKRDLLLRLVRQQNGGPAEGPGAAAFPTVEPDPARRNDPFPLTEIQQAYWIGRSAAHEIGDVSIHAYVEVEGDGIDLRHLEQSWRRVVARHDMLRAIVLPDGSQRILPAVPPYELQVIDARNQSPDRLADTLAATREELSHQVLPAESWPGFDIRATLLDAGRTRMHISIDLLHIDGGSLMILIDEWMRLYRDDAADLPPLEFSYRDYVLGEIAQRDGENYQQSVQYWHDRIATLPPAPVLPVARARSTATRTQFRRRSATLEPGAWQRLKARATQSGLTPSAVLLSAYADVLGCWTSNDAFTLNVTLFNRLPLHSQVNRILGDFTSLVLVEAAPAARRPFAERCAMTQRQPRQLSCAVVSADREQAHDPRYPGNRLLPHPDPREDLRPGER